MSSNVRAEQRIGVQSPQLASTAALAVNGVDPKLVSTIENEIVDRSPAVKWEDIGKWLAFYLLVVWGLFHSDMEARISLLVNSVL